MGGHCSVYGSTWRLFGQPEEKHDEFVIIDGLWTQIGTREQKCVCVCVCVCVCFALCFFGTAVYKKKHLLYIPTGFLSEILHIRTATRSAPEPNRLANPADSESFSPCLLEIRFSSLLSAPICYHQAYQVQYFSSFQYVLHAPPSSFFITSSPNTAR